MSNKFLELYKSNTSLSSNEKKELVELFSDDLCFDEVFSNDPVSPVSIAAILESYGNLWVTIDSDPSKRRQPHAIVICDITRDNTQNCRIKYYDVSDGEIKESNFTDFIIRVKGGSLDLKTAAIRLIRKVGEGAIPRPKWSEVYAGYPKNATGTNDLPATDVFTMVFGSAYEVATQELVLDKGTSKELRIPLTNACATRVSIALTAANISVSKNFIGKEGIMKDKGLIVKASKMKTFLETTFGKADIHLKAEPAYSYTLDKLKTEIGAKNGFYVLIAADPASFGASGHASLWVGANKDVIGGHNYATNMGEVFFWELS